MNTLDWPFHVSIVIGISFFVSIVCQWLSHGVFEPKCTGMFGRKCIISFSEKILNGGKEIEK
jgi:hypothetical protein